MCRYILKLSDRLLCVWLTAVSILAVTVFGVEAVRAQFTQEARLATNVANDEFASSSVAIEGDTAVVSMNTGLAVYVRSGSSWTQQAILVPSDTTLVDAFVDSAISGNTIVVGVQTATIGQNTRQGAAYVFVRNGTIWTQLQRLVAEDGAAEDRFGSSVSIEGETILVGAPQDDVGANTDQGSVYAFQRQGTTWNQTSKLNALDGGPRHYFGHRVAMDSNTALLANSRHFSANPQPAVYVFVHGGSSWSQQTKLSVCEPSSFNQCNFGDSVAVSGDTAAVGNSALNVGANPAQGGVYVFVRSGGTWTQQQRVTAVDGLSNDNFGWRVSIDGDNLLIGANALNVRPGAAYLYGRSNGSWIPVQKLSSTSTGPRDAFGHRVSLSGSRLIIARPRDNQQTQDRIGSAYIYSSSTSPAHRVPFDFDGDSKTDISVFRPGSSAQWWRINSGTATAVGVGFGTTGDQPVPADYTGDGKTDIAFFRPGNSTWYVVRSNDNTFYAFPFGGQSGDINAPADYDGDGKADPAVFRSGTWFILKSSDSSVQISSFGTTGDKPIPADYDADGKADLAIHRNASGVGQFWILRSTAGLFAAGFGNGTDNPVPGDFTGDGKADIAFYRDGGTPNNWFVLRSNDGFASFYAFPFGAAGDKPAPGDFDGDGKFDAAVFRPSNSNWYLNRSTAGGLQVAFGTTGDVAMPGVYVR